MQPAFADTRRIYKEIGKRLEAMASMAADMNRTSMTTLALIAESRELIAQADAILTRNGKLAGAYDNPPSITRNLRRRSGAVSVGSGVAIAGAASINSPSDHGRSVIPGAMAGVV